MDMKTSPLATLADPTLLKTNALINGEWVAGSARFAVQDPATGGKLADVANLGAAEIEAALQAANKAWPAWRAKTAKERAAILMKWFHLLHQHADDLARIMTAEQGKPLAEAKGEVGYGASFIDWFAEEAKRVYGETIPTTDNNKRYLVIKQAMGVCAAITPWNFPIAMITRKVAPALAAGCPVVIKPAEQTPLSALAVAELAQRAGMPAGVLNVITADGDNSISVGKVLCASDIVRHLSFTGSTEVGRILAAQCAPTIKKLSLELGGNAPFIVFDDADLDSAVEGAMVSKYRNAGQTCVCANRLYVQDSVYDAFVEKLAAKVRTIKVGTEPRALLVNDGDSRVFVANSGSNDLSVIDVAMNRPAKIQVSFVSALAAPRAVIAPPPDRSAPPSLRCNRTTPISRKARIRWTVRTTFSMETR